MTGERLEIKPGRSYVLGRSAECDLVVRDVSSSRLHARIAVSADGSEIFVQDLDSRNGTYVNDRKIESSTRLENHSRIRIGSTFYLVSFVDAGARSFAAPPTAEAWEMTVALEKSRADRGLAALGRSAFHGTSSIAGQLGAFQLREVLNLLRSGRANGALHVASEAGRGRVEVRAGEFHHAEFRALQGIEALRAMTALEAGLFWFLDGSEPCARTIDVPASDLLADAPK